MAKISKIRFVNFTYNDNRHIYDQTLDFYNGQDTLLNLQNGGGKTVLVQMMMQPIIPKQKLKDRLFKSYFANSKAPVYIMIEWILDDSTTKVLTGIGIKRVLGKNIEDESESLKIITFISEYEKESNFDIKNLELLEEDRGIVRLVEFEKVIKNLSSAEKEGQNVSLFRWDLHEDKKEYSRRLMTYKINQLEWKNLMVRINESEAGLNSFFNDCKTNSALIKKWFIPTIEEQLNKNGNFVENIKELIKNHAQQLVKNEDMIKEREVFEAFKNRSVELLKCLNEYKNLVEKTDESEFDLANSYLFVAHKIKVLETKKVELLTSIKELEEGIKELEYERLSSEYHDIASALQYLKDNLAKKDKEFSELKSKEDEIQNKKNILLCSKLDLELKDLNSKIAKFETELERENLQQEDTKNRINDLEFSLKEKYRDKIIQVEETLNNEKNYLEQGKNRLDAELRDFGKTKNEIVLINDRLISIRSRIAVFAENEENIKTLYNDFHMPKNIITGEYDNGSIVLLKTKLKDEEENLENKIEELKEKISKSSLEILEFEKACKEFREKNSMLAIEKSKKEAQYATFEDKKIALEKISKSYQLTAESIFDKEKLLNLLNLDLEKYKRLINDKNLENSILKKTYNIYESGKVFELSDDIKRIFDEKNIFVEFGYEWLRSISDNKIAKLKLIKNNPFLPYALIVAKKDFKLIQETEFKAFATSVIPIIEREKLEKEFAVKSKNNIHSVDDIDFLISFDDRILNKNYLKEVSEEISFKVNKNNEIIKSAQESARNIEVDIIGVDGFSYTQEGVISMKNDINTITNELEENGNKIIELEDEVVSLRAIQTADNSFQGSLQNAKTTFNRKKEDIEGLINKCHSVFLDIKDKKQKEDALKVLSNELEVLEIDISKTRNNINDINMKISNISGLLEKNKESFEKYRDIKTGNYIDEAIEILESKLAVFTSEISGKIQSLRDILEDYKKQRNDKNKLLMEYDIDEHIYTGVEFKEYEFEGLEEDLNITKNMLNEITSSKNEIQYKIAEINSDLKYMLKDINEKCSYDMAKDKENIRELDFNEEKKQLFLRLKDFEKELANIKTGSNNLQRLVFSLEEYAIFASKVIDIRNIEEDVAVYSQKLIKDYKELKSQGNEIKNSLMSLYSELEAEFAHKADVFKNLFKTILDGDKKFQGDIALNAFSRVSMQIDRKLEQHSIDIKKIDTMENCIIDNTVSYVKNVYDEMNNIDAHSTIEFDGKRSKMLIINLPPKDELDNISLKEYLKGTVGNCVNLYKQGKSMEGLLSNEINTYDLFDRLVSINKVEITLIKIEPNKLKKKTWKQVIEQNSGGEKFVSAFVVFISLLTYMRGDNLLGSNADSKVLIMDNPFGPITSEHLLKPLFEISKKYNTQLICLTDLKEHTIFDRFNLIYSLNIEKEVGREDEYIELKTLKKDIEEKEDEIISVSMFKIEDRSRFELMN